LREERVERDPVLCESLNEDVGFIMDLNLGIKSYVSHVLLHLLIPTHVLYLIIEHILFRSSLLSISIVVLILLAFVLVALWLINYLIPHFIVPHCSRIHCLTCFLVQIVMSSFLYLKLPTGHCLGQPDKV
jgi:hypothetical protein